MNTQEMMRILDGIARDRRIDKTLLIKDLEQAMISAARKYYNTLDTEEFACTFDTTSGELNSASPPRPAAGDEARGARAHRRADVQAGHDPALPRRRADERVRGVYQARRRDRHRHRAAVRGRGAGRHHRPRRGVHAALRADPRRAVPARRPRALHDPGRPRRGNQVKIVLTRSHPDFIKRLFEVEVPEVAERIIEIKAMAREAGYRTKIAVTSVDIKVDAVGRLRRRPRQPHQEHRR